MFHVIDADKEIKSNAHNVILGDSAYKSQKRIKSLHGFADCRSKVKIESVVFTDLRLASLIT